MVMVMMVAMTLVHADDVNDDFGDGNDDGDDFNDGDDGDDDHGDDGGDDPVGMVMGNDNRDDGGIGGDDFGYGSGVARAFPGGRPAAHPGHPEPQIEEEDGEN